MGRTHSYQTANVPALFCASFALMCLSNGYAAPASPPKAPPSASEQQNLGLNLPAVKGAAQRNTNVNALPGIESAPPPSFAGYLGQTLVLHAKLRPPADRTAEKVLQAWVINGKVVCESEICKIPLDGKFLKAASYNVIYIVYNSSGSVSSSHTLHVLQGGWKVGSPFNPKFVKDVPAKPVNVFAKPAESGKPAVEMTAGNGVLSYPGHLEVVGSVPRPLGWKGRLRTGRQGVAKFQQNKVGEWYLLQQSDVNFVQSDKVPQQKVLRLTQGGIRQFLGSANSFDKSDATKKRNFLNDLRIDTAELSLIPEEGSDIYVRRVAPSASDLKARATRKAGENLPLNEMYATKIVVISGKASVTITAQPGNKPLEVPPGVEFAIYESGYAPPFNKPLASDIEKLYKSTFSPLKLIKKPKQDTAAAAKINLDEHLKKVDELLGREDYFEALSELSLVEGRASEDVRIPYYLGLANKGLYQAEEAEKFFKVAMAQDPKYPLPPWQLAQMRLDAKKWKEAKDYLDEAASRMSSDDKLYPEYLYYAGVASFQLGSGFVSKSDFTRALWESQLDSALKSSAGGFLQTIGKQKPWSIIVPMGIQYDQNALSLGNNVSVPESFPRKYTYRGIAGTIFNYDFSGGTEAPGLYHAANAKAIYVKNFPAGFESLDAIVAGIGVTQTLKQAGPPAPGTNTATMETTTFTEGVDLIYVNKKRTIESYNFAVNYKKIDLGLTFERDPINTGSANRNAIILKQGYPFAFGSIELPFTAEERNPLKVSSTNGRQLTLTLTPGYTIAFSPRSNVKFTNAFGTQVTFVTPRTTLLKTTPGVNYSYFLTPWMLSILGANYEWSRESPTSKVVNKPGASLMLTGLF